MTADRACRNVIFVYLLAALRMPMFYRDMYTTAYLEEVHWLEKMEQRLLF